jgi:mono/diheme cytochrome c family protein
MFKRISLVAVAAALILANGYADQSTGKVIIPVTQTNPTNGKQMYTSYCAPCHGVDAHGHGPVASVLKSQPTDLTLLAKLNHGKYPDSHVVSVLEFGSELPSHGSGEMPVWGILLGKMDQSQNRNLRISNLTRYLESLQVK